MSLMFERPPLSFARAIARCIELIGAPECAAAIGKSPALVRKAADSGVSAMLNVEDCFHIDQRCFEKTGHRPILAQYQRLADIDDVPHTPMHALQRLGRLNREVGEAIEALAHAFENGSPNAVANAWREVDEAAEEMLAACRDLETAPQTRPPCGAGAGVSSPSSPPAPPSNVHPIKEGA